VFRVVENTCNTPIRMIARPGVKFIPGRVAKLYTLDSGTLACDIGDENDYFGIIDSFRLVSELSFEAADMVELWTSRMVFRTDQYDKKCEYKTGNSLYVGKKGLFTTQAPRENATYVAKVITGPEAGRKHFEALWL
jgi:hypothetical protein